MRLPSTAVVFAAGLAGIMVVIVLAKGLTDPDFFTHVRTGQLIVDTGQVPTTDPFSFTWAGQPWVLHEWLSEVLMYFLISGPGVMFSLIAFGLVPGALLAVLLYAVVKRGVPLRPAALACVLAAWVFIPYVTIRPQAFSWLLMAVLVTFLWGLDAAKPRRALWLIPLFILWANVHGLWVVGLGVVTLYGLFTLAGRTPMAGREGLTWVGVAFVGCLLGVMLTPAGPAGVLYPLRYIDAGDWGLANIHEWQSPDFHGAAHLGLLTLILTLLAVGRLGRRARLDGRAHHPGRGHEPDLAAQRARSSPCGRCRWWPWASPPAGRRVCSHARCHPARSRSAERWRPSPRWRSS